MSLQTRLEALVAAIGPDIKAALAKRSAQDATFTAVGAVATFTGTSRWYPSVASTINFSRASLNTTGSTTTTVVIKKNGTTAVTLSLTSGTATITSSTSVTLALGDYITVDVTAAGTGASDLTVQAKVVDQ